MSNITTFLFFISSVYLKYKPKTAKLIIRMLWKKRVLYGHRWSWLKNFIQCHCTSFGHRHSLGKLWARLDQSEIRYAPDKDFINNFAVILTLDLETWFKDTENPLPKGTLWVKYDPNLVKGVCEDMLRTSSLGRTNGRKDGRKDWSL